MRHSPVHREEQEEAAPQVTVDGTPYTVPYTVMLLPTAGTPPSPAPLLQPYMAPYTVPLLPQGETACLPNILLLKVLFTVLYTITYTVPYRVPYMDTPPLNLTVLATAAKPLMILAPYMTTVTPTAGSKVPNRTTVTLTGNLAVT